MRDLSVNRRLDDYGSTAEAIARLLSPHAEVIIHDLASGKIAHIFNVFSRIVAPKRTFPRRAPRVGERNVLPSIVDRAANEYIHPGADHTVP